jgi:glucuronokinase
VVDVEGGVIQHSVPARVGILGNPSDGYGGRALSMAVEGMLATVSVTDDEVVRITGPNPDPFEFGSVDEFVHFIDRYGYGTGEQLLAATLRTFLNLASSQGWNVPAGVDIAFNSTIPRGVGLAGSSALVIALLKGLLEFSGHTLDDRLLPSLALSVETDQLGIVAGLQDRVVQTYGGLVAMDFGDLDTDARTGLVYGSYEILDSSGLPRMFVAFSAAVAQPSSTYHSVLRSRYESGDPMTIAALHELAALVTRGKAALRWGGHSLGSLMTRNMELRIDLAPVPDEQMAMVLAAHDLGLDATFTGSGGAIVGVYEHDDDLDRLGSRLGDPESVVIPIETFSYRSLN